MEGVFANPKTSGSIQIVPYPGPVLPYNFTREGANNSFNSFTTVGTPSVTTIPSPAPYDPAYGNGPYRALVLGANGKLYSAPWLASSDILVIDPATDTASMQSFGVSGLPFDTGNYTTGCLAPNGKIYFPPWDNDKVLVIDPANGTSYYLAQVFVGQRRYTTSVLGANGKIYCLGRNSCLVIDPATDTTNITTFNGVVPSNTTAQAYYWYSCVKSLADDKLYFTGSFNYLIVIDTSGPGLGTAVRNDFNLTELRRDGQRYAGIANGKNGLLHLTPFNGTNGLYGPVKRYYSYIQPIGGGSYSVDVSGVNPGNPGTFINYGAINGDDGGVYSIPYAAGLGEGKYIYNRSGDINNVQWGTFNITIPADHRWFGGCLAPNGKIYSLPDMAGTNSGIRRHILITNTGGDGRLGPNFKNLIDTSYFNKGGT